MRTGSRMTMCSGLLGLALVAGRVHGQVPELIRCQGNLVRGVEPLNGEVSMVLRLYDSEKEGRLLYADSNTVAVVDGAYAAFLGDDTVQGTLADALSQPVLYLETVVEGHAIGPRERIVAVGYALKSRTADYAEVAGAVAAAQAGRTELAGQAETAAVAGSAQGLQGVPVASVPPKAGQVLTYDGTQWLPLEEGTPAWELTGNANTTNGIHFLGTTDNQPLDVRVNNARALRLEPAGGIPNIIGGHSANVAAPRAYGSVIGGGASNEVRGNYSVIGGGCMNTLMSTNSVIAGGFSNAIPLGMFSVIGGGWGNQVSNHCSAIVGGGCNVVTGFYAFVGGGYANTAGYSEAAIMGGDRNWAFGAASVIGGGKGNLARGTHSAVLGGLYNSAFSMRSVVGGGCQNVASNIHATVGGGFGNVVTGSCATVPGGANNLAGGRYSFAAGRRAKAVSDGAFVWADSADADFASTSSNQFLIRASGGVGIGTNSPAAALDVRGNIKASGTGTFAAVVGNGSGLTEINGSSLAPGSVSSTQLAAGAVAGDKIAASTITPSNLAVAAFSNTFWQVGGNAGAGTPALGTLDNESMEIWAGGSRAARFEPWSDYGASSPNVILGASLNSVAPGAHGATIGGGGDDWLFYAPQQVGADFGTIAGGAGNDVFGSGATIGGGVYHEARGEYAVVPGGYRNQALGDFSFAAGCFAKAAHPGAFVWADTSSSHFFSSGTNNQFVIRAANGVGINTNDTFGNALVVAGKTTLNGELTVRDAGGKSAFNTESRLLQNSAGQAVLNWEACELYGAWRTDEQGDLSMGLFTRGRKPIAP